MENLLKQTENLLKLRGYRPKTNKLYLLYIKQYLEFAKRNNMTDRKEVLEKFLLEKVISVTYVKFCTKCSGADSGSSF